MAEDGIFAEIAVIIKKDFLKMFIIITSLMLILALIVHVIIGLFYP